MKALGWANTRTAMLDSTVQGVWGTKKEVITGARGEVVYIYSTPSQKIVPTFLAFVVEMSCGEQFWASYFQNIIHYR